MDLPRKRQRLCDKMVPTEGNWQHARYDFDLSSMTMFAPQCSDQMFGIRWFRHARPGGQNAQSVLNFTHFTDTDVDKCSALIFSVCLPGEF